MRNRSWMALGAIGLCAATLGIGAATSAAAPRRGGDEVPDGGDDSEPTRDPIDRPSPSTKPNIPGFVLSNDAYYRERTLSLCEWGQGERSFYDQFIRSSEEMPPRWMCSLGLSRHPQTGDWQNHWCNFAGPPDVRPTDATYSLLPFDFPRYYTADMEWPDGSAAYSGWGVACSRASSSSPVSDNVVSSTFEGKSLNDSACPAWPNQGRRPLLVAQVVGGDVEHVRPAIVRALARVGFNTTGGPQVVADDLVLAIQVFGTNGWEDIATVTRTTSVEPKNFELEATVPEGSFVRMQLRGSKLCLGGYREGAGYDVRSARIQVETCIPDQSNPGHCL
jgi:hypothetical protein